MRDPTNPFQDRGEVQRALGKFCNACQAIPIHGYCNLAGCPTGRLRDREFFAVDTLVMAASEGGANDIATAQDEEIASTIADALTKAHAQIEPPSEPPLTTIIDWYQGLPKRAREGLSLANLHDLSKRLARVQSGSAGTDAALRSVDRLEDPQSVRTTGAGVSGEGEGS